jgi:hypothetical protein
MQPPPSPRLLTASCPSHKCSKFSRFRTRNRSAATLPRQPVCTKLTPFAFSFALTIAGRLRLFLFFKTDETRTPRPRNFDTTLPSSYRYEFRSDNRLESVANAHTAADCTSAPFLKPRWSQDRGAANEIEITRCVASRNALDSTQVRLKATQSSRRQRSSRVTRKQVFESAHRFAYVGRVVTIHATHQKNSQILQGDSRETEFFKRFASLWG